MEHRGRETGPLGFLSNTPSALSGSDSIDLAAGNQYFSTKRFLVLKIYGEITVPLRILLADDSMTAQNLGKKILTDAGYEVTAVSNGAAATKKLVDNFDIIILDVFMPGYTGLEVCEKVRASLETGKTPVL